MHSPDLAALALSEPVPLCAEPDCIDTDGPFGPIVVEPLSPPGPVLIVVEFEEEPLWDVDPLPWAAPPCETRHGLLLSITLTAVAASWIARLLHRHRWIGYVGLAIVLYVAVHMIWDGARAVAVDLGKTEAYNAAMPSPLDIRPSEEAKRKAH